MKKFQAQKTCNKKSFQYHVVRNGTKSKKTQKTLLQDNGGVFYFLKKSL